MNFINLETQTTQRLIRWNKIQIKQLTTEKVYLQHIIQLYYNSCNPIQPEAVLSKTAFICLNKAKEELVAVKKNIGMLTELQWQLKNSLRGG